MRYDYSEVYSPNLDQLETRIIDFNIKDIHQYLRWDEADEILKVYMSRELSTEEKATLDTLVSQI